MGYAQSSEVSVQTPQPPRIVGPVLRPFHLERRVVAPARLTNSARLESLVRSGNLYLTAQDVIALVLENNLDIAVQRYSPFLAREVIRRTEGGGYLRQVDTPVLAGPVSVSLAGVSVNANGLAGGAGVGAGGGIVSQIGPIPPNLDPNLYVSGSFGHLTTPETNTLLNETSALTNDYRQFVTQYSQQFVTGTNAQFTLYAYRSNLNSPTPLLNPAITGYLDLQVSQNLLQGLSAGVNNRDIRVARNNLKVSNLQVKRQVVTTVSAVLNLYWDLVSFNEDVRIKQQALATAEKLLEDNKKQVDIGTLSPIEVTRAAAEASASKEDLLIAQTNVQQQEMVLKNAISRNGATSAWLDEVHIIPLDHIEVPPAENIKPIPELVVDALSNRMEIEQDKVNIDSQKILLNGDKNGLLPSLQAFMELTNHGLAGPDKPYLQWLLRHSRSILCRRYGERSGTGFPAKLPGLFRRILAHHSFPQPGAASRLCYRPAIAQAGGTATSARREPGPARREECRDRLAAGEDTPSDRCGYSRSGGAKPEGRAEPLSLWCLHRGPGNSGTERPGAVPERGSPGDGQLHPRQDCL